MHYYKRFISRPYNVCIALIIQETHSKRVTLNILNAKVQTVGLSGIDLIIGLLFT